MIWISFPNLASLLTCN